MADNDGNAMVNRRGNEVPSEQGVVQQPGTSREKYFAAFPDGYNIYKNPFKCVYELLVGRGLAWTKASDDVMEEMNNDLNWQQHASLLAIQVLWILYAPMLAVGTVIELIGNTLVVNGGLFKTLYRLLISVWFLFKNNKEGPFIVPVRGSVDYKTLIGLVDQRTALYVHPEPEDSDQTVNATIFPGPGLGSRRTGEVLVMAAKLAYENAAVFKKVVTEDWKMNFVGFYNCWNEFQQRDSTQVYIFTDKAEDANAVVVAWRGTEAFNTYDWSTDIDFSWYDLKEVGKVHLGFLEALGLGDRSDMDTFIRMRKRNAILKTQDLINDYLDETVEEISNETKGKPIGATLSQPRIPASGLSEEVINAPEKDLAYDVVTEKLREIFSANPSAKLYITGHSLGGALSVLYAGMLYYNKETFLTDRIAAMYTFGQPRVGDEKFASYMLKMLTVDRYYRVVYCNDIVPRVPFDDIVFKYKHLGMCFYFNTLYNGQTLHEAPNKNFFFITDVFIMHLTAVWELVHSLSLRFKYGPEFQESTASILFRTIGVLCPGLGSHNPVNYVNSLRLGAPLPLTAKIAEETHCINHDIHDLEASIRKHICNLGQTIHSSITSIVLRSKSSHRST